MNSELESAKLLQDWSKWLIAVQSAACIALWPRITADGDGATLLFLAWITFGASVLSAAILLLILSSYVCRLPFTDNFRRRAINLLAVVQCSLFVLGVLLTASHLLIVALPTSSARSDPLTVAAARLQIHADEPLRDSECVLLGTLLSNLSSDAGGLPKPISKIPSGDITYLMNRNCKKSANSLKRRTGQ